MIREEVEQRGLDGSMEKDGYHGVDFIGVDFEEKHSNSDVWIWV